MGYIPFFLFKQVSPVREEYKAKSIKEQRVKEKAYIHSPLFLLFPLFS